MIDKLKRKKIEIIQERNEEEKKIEISITKINNQDIKLTKTTEGTPKGKSYSSVNVNDTWIKT